MQVVTADDDGVGHLAGGDDKTLSRYKKNTNTQKHAKAEEDLRGWTTFTLPERYRMYRYIMRHTSARHVNTDKSRTYNIYIL